MKPFGLLLLMAFLAQWARAVSSEQGFVIDAERTSDITAITFSPDSSFLAVGFQDGNIDIFSVSARKREKSIDITDQKKQSRAVHSLVFGTLSHLYVCRNRGVITELIKWDLNTNKVTTIKEHVSPEIERSPDGNLLAFLEESASGSNLYLWDNRRCKIFQKKKFYGAWGEGVTFSPDGRNVIVSLRDNYAANINAANIHILEVLPKLKEIQKKAVPYLTGSLSFSQDGKYLGVGTGIILNADTFTPVVKFSGNCEKIIFCPDGMSAIRAGDGMVVWDLIQNHKVLQSFTNFPVAFSPDGKHIAAHHMSEYTRIAVWSYDWLLKNRKMDDGYVPAVGEFPPDGTASSIPGGVLPPVPPHQASDAPKSP